MSVIPCGGLSQELRPQAKIWAESLQHTSQSHKELRLFIILKALDLVILKVFPNLKDSIILLFYE